MPTIYKGSPCRNGHPGMRYATTRNCVDCHRAKRRERYAAEGTSRRVAGSGDVPAALFRANYLAMYAPEAFDAEGWKQTPIGRFDE